MENNWCVYCHTTPSGKKYVGITGGNPERRWRKGKGYPNNHIFSAAIKKYGWDNITHEILLCGLSAAEAKQKEVELIAKYKSSDRKYGYNFTSGGDGTAGYIFTYEDRQKMSQASRGRKLSDAHKKAISEALRGKPKTEQQKEKQRATMQGRKPSEETKNLWKEQRKGAGNPRYGSHCSEETKKKISVANKGKVISEENKKLISEMFSKPIYCVELGEVFSSREKLAERIGCHPSTISQAIRGHHGKPPTYEIKGFHITEEFSKWLK